MKYLQIILKNITRKKIRMLLTIGSFAVALFLFGVLVTINDAFFAGVEMSGADRLIVKNKTSVGMLLPYSYKEKIKQVPGVASATPCFWFSGVYKDPKNFFVKFALEDNFREIYPEYVIPEDQWQAYLQDRRGCIVGRKLADRFGFKPGDRMPLQGIFLRDPWEFTVRAIYENSKQEDDTAAMFFHYKYFNERREGFDRVVWFIVKVENPETAAQVARAIDARFANSADETLSETEYISQTRYVTMVGNISLILTVIGAVVFITLLLVTGSTMAMAVRERTGEIGVLKTVGFNDTLIMVLVLVESIVLALAGGGLGLGLAKLYTLGGDPSGGMFRLFYLSPVNIGIGLAIAAAVGAAAGIMPAFNAMRLSIVDAIRRV